MSPRDDASQSQVDAANPAGSTWLSANAGSGKTRVLTDRVARLLFDKTDPQNILCLTYTKAAASEMQNRLFKSLGQWAMMPDAALRKTLWDLGIEGALIAEDLARARTLFARAIETPGGLRIQTIHSFCAGLLRRFPLEAGVSPQFTELEDGAARAIWDDILTDMATACPEAVRGVARDLDTGDLAPLLGAILNHRAAFTDQPPDVNTLFGLDEGAAEGDALNIAFTGEERQISDDLIDCFANTTPTYEAFAQDVAGLNLESPTMDDLTELYGLFLYGNKDEPGPSKASNFPQSRHTKAVAAMAPIASSVHGWMDRVHEARTHILKVRAAEKTAALHAFASEFVRRYDEAKLAGGHLDFDDQITKARALLMDPRVAQWVLFRLDGGIDHILVDEAQDTSPAQWDVIRALAAEFAAGEGARADRHRTIFVVGDKKQSIYSFQGADPAGFDRMADHFGNSLADAGKVFSKRELIYSFRSSKAVLDLVDATFLDEAGAGLGDDRSNHLAFFSELPGRVDLWPPIPDDKPAKSKRNWYDPVDMVDPEHPKKILAREIALQIRRMIDAKETIPDPEHPGRRRPISEGDVLILLRGREPRSRVSLFSEIILACKKEGLNVAGADRLKVGAELAVRDVVALLQFLALPEDDLSLATALRSPLFGWSEDALYRLAQPRGGKWLWQALRDAAEDQEIAAQAMEIIRDLREQADFLRPYDLINRLLVRHGARKKLLARLGREAEDGIDALLGQSLSYERSDVPGLTGFLEWLAREDLEIKREMDSGSGQLRVMTVHGAKGLEAPVVFLPDTAKRNSSKSPKLLETAGSVIPNVTKAMRTPLHDALIDATESAQREEDRRLLYVALTRAQSWLIVCAAGDTGGPLDSWYGLVEAGMGHVGARDASFPTGGGRRFEWLDWQAAPLIAPPDTAEAATETLPDLGPVDRATDRSPTISPSNLGGAKMLPGDPGEGDAELAKARGSALHLLLEYLPDVEAPDREAFARQLLADGMESAGLSADELVDDAMRILGNPALAPLFAPGSMAEIGVTADVPGLGRMHGAIDRLVPTETGYLAVDYKSNRLVPDTAGQTPEGLLRQMAAYAAMIRQIWPDKTAEVAILWTATGKLMPLPDGALTEALTRASAP